jgi:SAM-dependent methyltransferase
VAFYVAQCREAATVLELGCGFGRVLQALARPERRVLGIDRDGSMLTLARARLRDAGLLDAVELRCGDMRRLALDETFDRILVPHTGLYCLETDADFMACLSGIAAHLRPGGRLIADAWAADAFHEDQAQSGLDDDDEIRVDPVQLAGQTWDVFERSRWDRAAQRIEAQYRLVTPDRAATCRSAVVHHYRTAAQVVAALEATGLRVRAVDGGFAGELYDDDADTMVLIAERACE